MENGLYNACVSPDIHSLMTITKIKNNKKNSTIKTQSCYSSCIISFNLRLAQIWLAKLALRLAV